MWLPRVANLAVPPLCCSTLGAATPFLLLGVLQALLSSWTILGVCRGLLRATAGLALFVLPLSMLFNVY